MRRLMIGAAVAVLLAGAAGCAAAGDAGSGAGSNPPPRRPGLPLVGTEWQLIEVVGPSGNWTPPAEVDSVLRFDGAGSFSATACNDYGGPVRIDADRLHTGQVIGTSMGCQGPKRTAEEAFVAVLRHPDGVRWGIEGDELRLDSPDEQGLRYRVRDTIFPTRDLTVLLRRQGDGGDYQFGWQEGNGQISLQWEWREGPGKPWGFASESREPDWTFPTPDVLVGDAGGDSFVFGVVPRRAARVVCRPAAGGPAVELESSTIPGARTWRAFGGLVRKASARGAAVVALDDRGRELGKPFQLP